VRGHFVVLAAELRMSKRGVCAFNDLANTSDTEIGKIKTMCIFIFFVDIRTIIKPKLAAHTPRKMYRLHSPVMLRTLSFYDVKSRRRCFSRVFIKSNNNKKKPLNGLICFLYTRLFSNYILYLYYLWFDWYFILIGRLGIMLIYIIMQSFLCANETITPKYR